MKKILLFLGFSITTIVCGQVPADVEHSFGIFNDTGFNGSVNDITIQTDGKFIVGGDFTTYNFQTVKRLMRFNNNCSIDNSFNIEDGFNGIINTIALQTDGKIIVGGEFTTFNGMSCNRIVRLNSNGSIDNEFSLGIGFNNKVKKIIVQPNGKILVGGYFTSYNGITQNNIVRLNTDGSYDSSFVSSLPSNFNVNDIALQQDNKILAGSDSSSYGGLKRLNSDGNIDNSFNIGTGFAGPSGTVTKIAVQDNGDIWVGGSFCQCNGFYKFGGAKLSSNGSLLGFEGFFSPVPNSPNPCGTASDFRRLNILYIGSDNKIYFSGNQGYLINTPFGPAYINSTTFKRINSDGSLDYDFNFDNRVQSNNSIQALNIQPDGKLLVGGNFTSYINTNNANLVRLYGSTSLSTYDISNNVIKLYPNPSSSQLNIQPQNNIVFEKIIVSDLMGKIVIEQTQNTNQISVEKLAKGVYFLNGYSDGNKFQVKFIKE